MDKKKPVRMILPIVAGIAILAAVVVVVFIPKNSNVSNDEVIGLYTTDEEEIVVKADMLTSDAVSFFKPIENSPIELLARIGDDGKAKVALGTCQSCNGAPGAYYTQEEDVLKCNNCGLTFPISVIDSPGGGCHPIMLDEEIVSYREDDIVIDPERLASYEVLFENVKEH